MPSPFGRLVLIVNPRAGRGEVSREMPELERRLLAGRLEHRIVETEGPGHAGSLARDALEAGDRFIVAVGGDGTIHEVVNGMVSGDRLVRDDAVLGVVSAGSGGDFVRTFGMPNQVTSAVRHLLGDRTHPLDVGRLTYRDGEEERTRYFVNIAEAGFGGKVVGRAARLPRLLGRGRYFLGFWLSIGGYRAGEVRVRADAREFSGKATNVVVANCQFFGGGMRISPRSLPADGVLDVQVSTGPKSEAFTLLPKIYRGDHVPHPHIREMKGAVVTVDADRPLPIEADGEVLGTTPARFEVLPELLQLKL
ncbi:MAG TPA: diacylglycerol kinase family protein [Actinomycetota bacterium]